MGMQHISPDGVAPARGYSRVVTAPGRLVAISEVEAFAVIPD